MNNNNNNKKILIKTPQYETSLENLRKKVYLKMNHLMPMSVRAFGISLHNYPELRGEILNISNFIKRMPYLEREIM